MNQKTCDHSRIREWYAGGRQKGQCLVCYKTGLIETLMCERRKRCSHPSNRRWSSNDGWSGCRDCGRMFSPESKEGK